MLQTSSIENCERFCSAADGTQKAASFEAAKSMADQRWKDRPGMCESGQLTALERQHRNQPLRRISGGLVRAPPKHVDHLHPNQHESHLDCSKQDNPRHNSVIYLHLDRVE
jgi:hypothetical protein